MKEAVFCECPISFVILEVLDENYKVLVRGGKKDILCLHYAQIGNGENEYNILKTFPTSSNKRYVFVWKSKNKLSKSYIEALESSFPVTISKLIRAFDEFDGYNTSKIELVLSSLIYMCVYVSKLTRNSNIITIIIIIITIAVLSWIWI